MIKPATVYLVGAGPGDPDLITVKGMRCLQRAEVVIYDRLANPLLLDYAPEWAEFIYVGKGRQRHQLTQASINRLLIEHSRAGRQVVRLKGGDPFIFGRGGEECQALAAASIPFEVVPGISSALAVPAYAGIPLTHRQLATKFTVVTGHTCGPDDCEIDWDDVPRSGTLVVLMGVRHLAAITRQLIKHGRPASTPAAVIGQGTGPDQTVVTGTLADIAGRAQFVEAPATIVVGEVVRLREGIGWFDQGSRFDVRTLNVQHSDVEGSTILQEM
jgi:uroporphyrin-III C-methyltransferase